MLNRERPGDATQTRITWKPACRVSGHVEFGYDADAAIPRVGDDFLHLGLCVKHAVGAVLLEPRIFFAFHPKALVVGKVPVKDVQFDRCKSVDRSFDFIRRKEVAGNIERQTAPGKTRLIANVDVRDGESWKRTGAVVLLNQLEKSLN